MIKAINVQTEERFDLAQSGDGNWLDWLAEQGYTVCQQISLSQVCLELYQREEDGVYALYHSPQLGLSVECLFINIPDEVAAQELIALAQRMAKIMAWSIQTCRTNTLGDKTA
ncbi:MAG: hypothetical protein WBG32_10945 [Nodosilinea sp.]